jgi:hypothetical protein
MRACLVADRQSYLVSKAWEGGALRSTRSGSRISACCVGRSSSAASTSCWIGCGRTRCGRRRVIRVPDARRASMRRGRRITRTGLSEGIASTLAAPVADREWGRLVWRASLEHVRTGEQRGFARIDALLEFFREQTDAVTDSPEDEIAVWMASRCIILVAGHTYWRRVIGDGPSGWDQI